MAIAQTYIVKNTVWTSLDDGHSIPRTLPAMLLGAAHYPATEAAFGDLEDDVGRMGIRRTYDTGSGIPGNFMSTAAATDIGKRASWQSVRSPWAETAAGTHDTAIRNYVNTIPVGHRTLLTWQHEPENDGGNAPDFVAGSRRFYQVVKETRPDIDVGPIAIGWTFDPGNNHNDRQNYFDGIGPNFMDFMAIDPYNKYKFPPAGNGLVWTEAPIPQFTSMLAYCDTIGVRPGLAETASAEDYTTVGPGDPVGIQRKTDWIDTMVATADAANCIAFCYFDTLVNNDLDPTAVLQYDPESIACWAALVAAHPTAV